MLSPIAFSSLIVRSNYQSEAINRVRSSINQAKNKPYVQSAIQEIEKLGQNIRIRLKPVNGQPSQLQLEMRTTRSKGYQGPKKPTKIIKTAIDTAQEYMASLTDSIVTTIRAWRTELKTAPLTVSQQKRRKASLA